VEKKKGRRARQNAVDVEMSESAATDRDEPADLNRRNPSADPNFDPFVGASEDSRMVILRNAVPSPDVKRRN